MASSILSQILTSTIKIIRYLFLYSPIRHLKLHESRFFAETYGKVFAVQRGNLETANYLGCIFNLPKHDITISPALLNGTYEKNELVVLKSLIKDKDVVFDVGANIGIFSIIASKYIPNGIIIAFEPEQNNLNLFKSNIELNNAKNITIETTLVGEKCSDNVKLYIEESSGTHSVLENSDKYIEISEITLDSYVESKNLKPDFIKIDVEGAESLVIAGMKKLIQSKPNIMFEFTPKYFKGDKEIETLKMLESMYGGFMIIDSDRLEDLEKVNLKELQKSLYCNVLLTNTH